MKYASGYIASHWSDNSEREYAEDINISGNYAYIISNKK